MSKTTIIIRKIKLESYICWIVVLLIVFFNWNQDAFVKLVMFAIALLFLLVGFSIVEKYEVEVKRK
jgi:hypothetical protein